jgi:hypothetical protein
LELSDNKQVYHLFPVKILESQPQLMYQDEAGAYLEKIADASSEEIKTNIKNKTIEIK